MSFSTEKCRQIRRALLLFMVCFVFNLLFSNTTSPLFPAMGVDPHVFEEFGLAILYGKIPYVDIFDHKGIYLYLINALGLGLDLHWGVSILQSLNLSIAVCIILHTVEIVEGTRLKPNSSIVVISFILLTLFCFESGNMSEDWSLAFIALPIYYLSKAIISCDKKNRNIESLLIGICIGIVTFIRANNIFPIFGFLFVALLLNIIRKKYRYIFKTVVLTFLGFCVGIMPAFLFQYYKGGIEAIDEMFFGTITSNVLYSSNNSTPSLSFFLKSFAPVIAFICITGADLRFCKNKCWIIALILSYLFCSIAIGKVLYRHYFLIFVSLFPLTLSLFLHKGLKKRIVVGVLFLIILITGINPLKRYLYSANTSFGNYSVLISQFDSMIRKIPESERQNIWNYNATEDVGLFVHLGLVQSNRFMFPHHKFMFERFRETEIERFSTEKPKWVIMKKPMQAEEKDKDLILNSYQVVDSTFVKESEFNVILLKKM